MVPGWADTFSWIRLADSLQEGPGRGPESATSELSLPSYCSSAGHPQYVRFFMTRYSYLKLTEFIEQVFDGNQGSNATYALNQHFLHYTPLPSLSQLISEGSFATVLNSTHSLPVQPLDTLTNTLVSPFFYGLQSTSVSDSQGRAVLTGVHIRQNLPGSWALQCGVDGVMMDTPVFVNLFFVSLAVLFVEMTLRPGDFG